MNDTALIVQNASASSDLPEQQHLQHWVQAAVGDRMRAAELCIRIVDEPEMTALNEQYRHKHGPTNVLAFAHQPVAEIACNLLGDIVICAPVVEREAAQQGKSRSAHWAHMVVHAVLHLLGYDHEQPQAAQTMEQLETDILTALQFPPPYEINNTLQTAGDTTQQ